MLFYQNGQELARVALSAIIMYIVCVLFISVFGKRSSAKMNNFDWMVTVAMGSILGSAVLLKKVVILEVALGLFTLLLMQFLFTWLSVHSAGFRQATKKSPTLLYYGSDYIHRNLRSERVTEEEVRVGARCRGYASLAEVQAVILEPNGELSIIGFSQGAQATGRLDEEVMRTSPAGVEQ